MAEKAIKGTGSATLELHLVLGASQIRQSASLTCPEMTRSQRLTIPVG